MGNFPKPVHSVDRESSGIRNLTAAAESRGRLLSLHKLWTAYFGMREILIPEQQVADVGEQASRADDVFDGGVLGPARSTFRMSVGQSPIRHDRAKIAAPARVLHSEGSEDVFAGEGLEILAICERAFDQQGEQIEAGVGVRVSGAGVKIESVLLRGQLKNVLVGVNI